MEDVLTDTSYLDRPGGRVAFDDSGGGGPLVVAAPGMGDTRGVYRHVRPAMIDAGLRFVTMDLRGMGETTAGWDVVTDEAIATDLLALVDRLDSGPAVLIGNSLSAASAVIAATDRPDRVAGLVLIGPFVRSVPLKWWQASAFRALLMPPWGRTAWVSYYRKSLYPGPRPVDHEGYVASLRDNLAEPGRFSDFRSMASNSHEESGKRLGEVRQPVLVVMGSADPDFPDPVAEANLLGEILEARVVIVEGSGHYPQADNPGLVAPAIVDFVQEAQKPRS